MLTVLFRSARRAQKTAVSSLRGKYTPPPDKSITHRALFLAALAKGTSQIKNPLATGDCLSTLNALQKLGVSIRKGRGIWTVKGKGGLQSNSRRTIDCGNSGTTIRLLTGILSSQGVEAVLSGDSSLKKRPMKRVIEPLRKMGAKITAHKDNFAPIRIHKDSSLRGITWGSPIASAQVKTALLLAGLSASGKTTVIEPAKSRDHTERMLKGLGVKVGVEGNRVTVTGGAALKGFNISVPGDFSSASFFIVAALIVPGSHLILRNVNLNPTRTGLLTVLKKMGAKIKVLRISNKDFEPVGDLDVRHSMLKGTRVSGAQIPLLIDEIPILAVAASQARGKTIVKGALELRVKESDRIAAIVSELKKMGANIKERLDGFTVTGPSSLRGAPADSRGDHRMAMALAVAGLVAAGKTKIKDFSCTRVSYPGFVNDLASLLHPKPR